MEVFSALKGAFDQFSDFLSSVPQNGNKTFFNKEVLDGSSKETICAHRETKNDLFHKPNLAVQGKSALNNDKRFQAEGVCLKLLIFLLSLVRVNFEKKHS